MSREAAADPAAVTIRPASAADVDAVARIWHAGWGDGDASHVPAELVAHRTAEAFSRMANERVGATWVAESGDGVVGFVVVIASEVEQVYVDPAARGTGLAVLLLRRAETVVRRAGHSFAWLAVVAGNARAFYTRKGWHDRGPFTYQAEVGTGTLAVPCHRYERGLAGVTPEPTA